MKMKDKKKLILLDIDGTIVDEKHDVNANLKPIINRLKILNWTVGLNSNRALEDMTPIYRELSLNGPLIIENGIYYKESIKGKSQLLLKSAEKLQKPLADLLKDFINTSGIPNLKYCIIDTSKYIGTRKEKINTDTNILLNKFRLYTGSIHVYEGKNPNSDVAQSLYNYLSTALPKNLTVSKPNKVANITIQPKNSSKADGIKYLKEISNNNFEKIYMVGNSLSDAKTLPFVNGFFAVGNSDNETKKEATFVAEKDYTAGVMEIFEYLINNFLSI